MADFSISDLFQRAFGQNRGKPYDGNQLNEPTNPVIEFEAESEIEDTGEGTEF